MPPARFSMWKKDKAMITQQSMQCILLVTFAVIMSVLLLLLFVVVKPLSICPNLEASLKDVPIMKQPRTSGGSRENIEKFDCMRYPQAAPVVANKVEGVRHPFFISLADLGSPEKPNRNFLRILKGKPFRKPDISQTVQDVLEKLESNGLASKRGTVVDVGANVGMAAFAAAAMGYKVAAFEAVFENLQRLCDGLYLNRAGDMVVGRLDNSAVSMTGAKLAFKSNEIVPVSVRSVTLDTVIPESEPVTLLKIDVQGWEYHVLKGASHLLSRVPGDAPYIIYEDDEKLLRESNTSSKNIRDFLVSMGYDSCIKHGTDTHCKKERTA